jgi:hypothetical protein
MSVAGLADAEMPASPPRDVWDVWLVKLGDPAAPPPPATKSVEVFNLKALAPPPHLVLDAPDAPPNGAPPEVLSTGPPFATRTNIDVAGKVTWLSTYAPAPPGSVPLPAPPAPIKTTLDTVPEGGLLSSVEAPLAMNVCAFPGF